jgi:hypothetical protein
MRNEEIEAAIAPYVDSNYYFASYPDVRATAQDPVQHYSRNGWKEGRDPNPWFCTKEYLRIHRDVAAAEINPLWHYVTTGRLEGRPLRMSAPVAKLENIDEATLSTFIDPAFYGAQAGIAFASREEAIAHFISHGDLGLLDPSPHFAAEYYFMSNINTQHVLQSPLLHYLEEGRALGLAPNPQITDKAAVIDAAEAAAEKSKTWVVHARPNILSPTALAEALNDAFEDEPEKVFVSVSHDDFLVNVGGIQLCLAQELANALERGHAYLHIAPYQSGLTILQDADPRRVIWRVSANGEALGAALAADVIEALAARRAAHQARWLLVLHHLIGHSEAAITQLAKALDPQDAYYWLHDYFFACEQYNLLRNDYDFCHAPPQTSTACEICVHGASRGQHLRAVSRILQTVNPHVLAPSESVAQLWRRIVRHRHKSVTVTPHCVPEFEGQSMDFTPAGDAFRPVRIAFVGYPAYHKGWPAFDLLAWAIRDDKRYQVYHFGQYRSATEQHLYVPTAATADQPDATISALRKHLIDIVVIWPAWPETFSIITTEAIAAGALVLTHENSGNCIALARQYDRALVFDTIPSAIAAFVNGDIQDEVRRRLSTGLGYGALNYGAGLTVALDDRTAPPKNRPRAITARLVKNAKESA